MVRTYFSAFSKALVALTALVSVTLVHAFGLGEITLNSYLNQPLDAEIEIIDKGDLAQDEIIPKLASEKDFANVGVQRNFFLTRLDFKVVFGDDRDYIKITSREPVNEPYLDFLIEFMWPEGRLLREYTVLLDPPSYAAQAPKQAMPVVQGAPETEAQPVVATSPASDESIPTETVSSVQSSGTQMETAPEAQSTPAPVVSEQERRTVTTVPGETFWSLASRERPDESVSVQQTMLAIQKLNPEAFENNNINYLKKNQVLRMPTEDEIRSLATREAMGIVADQNREWAGNTLARGGSLPMDTAKLVGSRQVTPMDDTPASADQMKLVADSGASGDAAGSYEGGGSGLGGDEAVRVSRENQRLSNENFNLKSQVETSERLISLKDQQIAELQARLEEQGADTSTSVDQQIDSVADEVAELPAEDSLMADDSEAGMQDEELYASDAEMQDMELAGDIDGETYDQADGSLELEDEMSFEADAEAAAELETLPETQAESKPKAKPARAAKQSSNLYLYIGIAAVLLLGAGGGFFLYKRRVSAPQEETAYDGMDVGGGLDELGEGFAEEEGAQFPGDEDFGGADSGDVITEANTYISYERWDQAIELLAGAIEAGNGSSEVKLKLLEAYAGAGDSSAFDSLRAELLEESPELEADISAIEERQAGEPAMDSTTRMDAGDFDLDANEEDFDISLDDLESDLGAGESSQAPAEDEDIGQSLDDLEGALDLDSEPEAEQVDEVSLDLDLGETESSAEEELDLDLDFSEGDAEESAETIIMQADSEPEAEEEVAEDDGLDLDLDFEDVAEEAEPAAESDGDEIDLSGEIDLDFEETSEPDVEAAEEGSELDLDTGDLDLGDSEEEDLGLDLDFDDGESEEEGESLDLGDLDMEGEVDSGDALDLEETVDSEDDGLDLDLDDSSDDELDLGDDLDLDSELDLDLGTDTGTEIIEEPAQEEAAGAEEVESADSLFEEGSDDDFDLPEEGDEAATKLDLARAYIDMGDEEGAKDILEEVLSEGDDKQKAEAQSLLEKL